MNVITFPAMEETLHPDGGIKSELVKAPPGPEPVRPAGTVTWIHWLKWFALERLWMSLNTVRSRVALAPPGSCDVPLVNWATIYRSLDALMVRTVHSHHATPRIVIESA